MSADLYPLFIKSFFAFLAIMNPLANIPVFLGVTGDCAPGERRALAYRSVLVALVLVALFALLGRSLLQSFGIEINSLRLFGGLVVVHVGYELITKSSSRSHGPSGDATHSGMGLAISPLGIPILAGPGTLATAISLSPSGSVSEHTVIITAFVLVAVITLVAFLVAGQLLRWLGEELIAAITKVMGMILGAIGTQMVIEGYRGFMG